MKESKEPEQKEDRTMKLGPSKDNPPFQDEMLSKQISLIKSKSMEKDIFILMREAGESYGRTKEQSGLAWSAFEAGGIWMHSKLKGQADRIASLEAEVKRLEYLDKERTLEAQTERVSIAVAEAEEEWEKKEHEEIKSLKATVFDLQAELERLKKENEGHLFNIELCDKLNITPEELADGLRRYRAVRENPL